MLCLLISAGEAPSGNFCLGISENLITESGLCANEEMVSSHIEGFALVCDGCWGSSVAEEIFLHTG